MKAISIDLNLNKYYYVVSSNIYDYYPLIYHVHYSNREDFNGTQVNKIIKLFISMKQLHVILQ